MLCVHLPSWCSLHRDQSVFPSLFSPQLCLLTNHLLFFSYLPLPRNQTKQIEVQWYTCGASGELKPITKTLTEKLQGQ